MYLQVVDQIKAAAASGALRPGELLPSIGALSGELRVNRNAIVKAYAELEGLSLVTKLPDGEYALKDSGREDRNDSRSAALTPQMDDDTSREPAAFKVVLQYTLLAIALVAIGLILAVMGSRPLVIVAVIAAAVFPLWMLAAKAAHLLVFAKRFELPRTLRALKIEASSQPDLDSFMERVAARTEPAIGAGVALVLDRGETESLVRTFPALLAARSPVAVGADLLMPVFAGDDVHGVLRLAPKKNGQEYGADDLEFLRGLSEVVATAASQFRRRHERQESEYARDIQQGLLPREIPQVAGFTIAGAWQPARNVGGDYYDVFQLSDTELALVIADVSGKGVPAALLMANLQATVKAYATVEPSPKELCTNVNRAVCKSITPGKFITFFYAVLDSESRRLTYANAGHNPPVVVRRDGACVRLEGTGAVIGVFANAQYEQAAVDLAPGDRLVLFTDGISEAADARGNEFGEERLVEHLRDSPTLSATNLRSEIMQRVTQFCSGDFSDDATLVTVIVE